MQVRRSYRSSKRRRSNICLSYFTFIDIMLLCIYFSLKNSIMLSIIQEYFERIQAVRMIRAIQQHVCCVLMQELMPFSLTMEISNHLSTRSAFIILSFPNISLQSWTAEYLQNYAYFYAKAFTQSFCENQYNYAYFYAKTFTQSFSY